MEYTFLRKLINRLSQDVFRPLIGKLATTAGGSVDNGLLYITLQSISREISGECPWDSGSYCQKSFSTYYRGPKCRNITCQGYLHPLGLISYTSRSSVLSSVDNRFDYNSFRWLTSDDFVPVGTYGAEIKFDFGLEGDPGGYGAGYYGAGLYGANAIPAGAYHVVIGDRWRIDCVSTTGAVGPAIPFPTNLGGYGPIITSGTYIGDFDTYYVVEIIDYCGWIQNFQDAVLQISLATATNEWVDYWGEYFGIPRLLLTGGYEDDSTYKARIMKEITRAKGTKPVLEEEARAYFGRNDISIIEYHQTYTPPSLIGDDRSVPLSPPNITWPAATYRGANQPFPWLDPDPAWGLQPYQFYIFPPTQSVPSSKWVKTRDNLIEPDKWSGAPLSTGSGSPKVYVQESALYPYVPPYGGDPAGPVPNVTKIDGLRNWLFITPAQVGDKVLFGCTKRFSGLRMVFSLPLIYDDGALYDEFPVPHLYEELDGSGGGSADGVYIWEYWNGTGWNLLTVTDTTVVAATATGSTITGGFGQDGWINWQLPGSGSLGPSPVNYSLWVKANGTTGDVNIPDVPDGLERYWIRCRIATPPTTVPDCNYVGFVYAGSTNRGCYNGTGVKIYPTGSHALPVTAGDIIQATTYVTDKQPAADGFSYSVITLYKGDAVAIVPPYGKRDIHNIYVYSGDAWAKPEWESGLQDIIDRLKTAGTVAIINPPT